MIVYRCGELPSAPMSDVTSRLYRSADARRESVDRVSRAEAIYAAVDLAGVAPWTLLKTSHHLRAGLALPTIYAMDIDPAGLNVYSVREWNSCWEREQRGWIMDFLDYWWTGIPLVDFEQVRTEIMSEAALRESDETYLPELCWSDPNAWEVLVAREAIHSMREVGLAEVHAATAPDSWERYRMDALIAEMTLSASA